MSDESGMTLEAVNVCFFLKKNMEHIVNIKSSKYQGFDNKENTNEINGAYQ